MSSNEPRVSESGGVTRMQWGAPNPEAPAPTSEIMRSGVSDGGAYRTTADGNVEQFGGVTRYVSNSDRDMSSDNITDTFRTPWGSIPTKVSLKDVCTVSGMPMTVQSAIRNGYLRQTSEFTFEATGTHLTERARDAAELSEAQGSPKVTRSPATMRGSNLKIA